MGEIKDLDIYVIRCPTPWAIGPTNSYLLKRDEVCLIDVGVKTEESISAFFEGLNSIAIGPEKIRKIFITHGHTDHFGFAESLSKKVGAEVYIHEVDAPKVSNGFFESMKEMINKEKDFFASQGIPESLIPVVEFIPQHNAELSAPIGRCNLLKWWDRIDLGDEEVFVVPLPGHTAGHVGYYLQKSKVLFSGDHIMPLLQFNPLYDMTQNGRFDFHILNRYEESLNAILKLNISFIAPGHRKILKNVEEVVKNRKGYIDKIREEVLEVLHSSEYPLSTFEITKRLNPSFQEWQILFSWTIILCILKEYESKGMIFSEEKDGVIYYGKV